MNSKLIMAGAALLALPIVFGGYKKTDKDKVAPETIGGSGGGGGYVIRTLGVPTSEAKAETPSITYNLGGAGEFSEMIAQAEHQETKKDISRHSAAGKAFYSMYGTPQIRAGATTAKGIDLYPSMTKVADKVQTKKEYGYSLISPKYDFGIVKNPLSFGRSTISGKTWGGFW